ncbi:hypothetical protein [Cyanobium sp. LEGE 06143]|nr:hypothetical protein [Cyanobium sp. LEGE 06143]
MINDTGRGVRQAAAQGRVGGQQGVPGQARLGKDRDSNQPGGTDERR